MIAAIRDWLDARARARIQDHYQNGFAYAASSLLQGVGVRVLEDEVDTLTSFSDEHDAFDAGVVAAVREWTTRFGGRVCTR